MTRSTWNCWAGERHGSIREHTSLLEASEFIHVIEARQGLKVACLEEIAWRKGWLDESDLKRQSEKHGKSSYGTYLRRLIDEVSLNQSIESRKCRIKG